MSYNQKGLRSVQGKLKAKATAEPYCSSEENERTSYYQLPKIRSYKLYNQYGKRNRKLYKSSSSSEDECTDELQSTTLLKKRQYESSSDIGRSKKKSANLSTTNQIQDSSSSDTDNIIPFRTIPIPHVQNTKGNRALNSIERIIQDVQNVRETVTHSNINKLPEQSVQDSASTNRDCTLGFFSSLIRVLDNIKKTFTMYDSRLDHLKRKYCENESVGQDDVDNVMFLFSCIMSKLKEDLDKEQKSFDMEVAKHTAITYKEVPRQSDELGTKNNKAIDSGNGHKDMTSLDVQLQTGKETRKHIESSESSNSASSMLISNETTHRRANDTANCVKELSLLNHLSEITIVNGSTQSKNSNGKIVQHKVTVQKINQTEFQKPQAKSKVDEPKNVTIMQRKQKSGYDTDMSTCSTIICRNPAFRRANNKTGIANHLMSERYGTSKPHFSKYNSSPNKEKETLVVERISSSDDDSTESEDTYRMRASSKPMNFRNKYPANSDNKSESQRKKGNTQLRHRYSPILVDLNTINDINRLYSEEDDDTLPKINKTIVPYDKKLRMNCVVELSKLKMKGG